MEPEREKLLGEIQESTDESVDAQPPKTGTAKVPEVEIHLYRQGKGPIAVFKSNLGGYEQDQLEIREILETYGFKSVYAFNRESGRGRGVPIRFHPRNGRSMLPYKDGSVIYMDGEPKDSLIKPVTKILIGVAITTILITLVVREPPDFLKKYNVFEGNFSPWILACMVIVFTRMRKRTKDFFNKLGW